MNLPGSFLSNVRHNFQRPTRIAAKAAILPVATHASDIGTNGLVACPECDLIQRAPAGAAAGTVICRRCGARIYGNFPRALDTTLALMISAAVLFIVANVFPVMSLELQGRHTSETLLGMARALQQAGMTSVALLVLATIVVMPALEISAMLYLLVPLRLGRAPEGLGMVSRTLFAVRPWAMAEVFTLAALVSIGRLGDLGDLDLGPGFWSIGAVMLLFAATDTIFDEHALWACASALRRAR